MQEQKDHNNRTFFKENMEKNLMGILNEYRVEDQTKQADTSGHTNTNDQRFANDTESDKYNKNERINLNKNKENIKENEVSGCVLPVKYKNQKIRKEDNNTTDVNKLINNVLGYNALSETHTPNIETVDTKNILTEDMIKKINTISSSEDPARDCHSGTVSIFASGNDLFSKCLMTSTPKRKSVIKPETQRFNKEEINYTERVSLLIINWMETLPMTLDGDENKRFKQVMIQDLAGDIIDQLKIEQLAPQINSDRDQVLYFAVLRWLYRFDVYEDLNDARPQVNDFVTRLHEIPVPNFTHPQQGHKEAMAHMKHYEGKIIEKEDDVLRKEISNWVNEQPDNIYSKTDKHYHNKMIKELAETVRNRIGDKNRENKLDSALTKWLKIMLKSSEKKNISSLAQNLKSRITKIPHDASRASNVVKNISDFTPSTSKPIKQDVKIITTSKSGTTTDLKHSIREGLIKENKKICLKENFTLGPERSKDLKINETEKIGKEDKNKQKHNCSCSLGRNKDDKTSELKVGDIPKHEKHEDKINGQIEPYKETSNVCQLPEYFKKSNNDMDNNDRTLIEIIGKYMERNDGDNSLVKGAFDEILKAQFHKLSPSSRNEVSANVTLETTHDKPAMERLDKEFQYIDDISDWLKTIPIFGSYNNSQKEERIKFVNGLAKNICEVEERQRNEPGTIDYNMQLECIITDFAKQLPILPEHMDNIKLMINKLVNKVASKRATMPCANMTVTSFNSSGIPEQNISEFIENYIRLNARDIDDPFKLEAWSARVLEEAKRIIRDATHPSTCKADVCNKLTDISISDEDYVRLFELELDYAKEITNWLNNLPLLPITTFAAKEQRVKMISYLAEKFADRQKNKIANPTEHQPDNEIVEYITNWLNAIPLECNKEIVIPVLLQQLLRRIERINRGSKEVLTPQRTAIQMSMPKKPRSQKNKSKCSKSCGGNAGQLAVDAIENWSNSLPIQIKDKDAEKSIKDGVARKLYEKVGDLIVDPETLKNDRLFEDLLIDEVNHQLDSLPQNSDIQKKRETLTSNLVYKIMAAKSLTEETSAGENYKEELEHTVDESIPNPISHKHFHDPRFEMYKNRLTEMFILENFDHGNDEAKLKYEEKIKKEMDKYYQNALRRNALPLTKDQIYNELFSALYKIQMPGENSRMEEVEIVKTRCEIADWFTNLPLVEASFDEELLNRDKIQSMLAKRLREIENEHKPDEKMHKEVTKWLKKLPLHSGNEENIDKFANDLKTRLKFTQEDRKCVASNDIYCNSSNSKRLSKPKDLLGVSQVAGPSSVGQVGLTPEACCQVKLPPRQKSGDIILEIIQDWCESLPLCENPENVENNRLLREDLGTKIIIKICELNGDPKIFLDATVYDYLINEEFDRLLSNFPLSCDQRTKDNKKSELIQKLKSVKPFIKEERARYEYRKELNETVNRVLKEPISTTAENMALLNEIREEIVDDYIQSHHHRDDENTKRIYKAKLRDEVEKLFPKMQDQSNKADTLIKYNQLLCEMGKIENPGDISIEEEVEEIRMKDEVKQFFEEILKNDKTTLNRSKIEHTLAKILSEIEKTGHNCSNDAKMKKVLNKYLKKLDKTLSGDKIELFVDNLKSTEAIRKAHPVRKEDSSSIWNQNDGAPNSYQPYIQSGPANFSLQPYDVPFVDIQNSSDPRVAESNSLCCPHTYTGAMGVAPVEYQGFGHGIVSSSPQSHQNDRRNQLQNTTNHIQTAKNTNKLASPNHAPEPVDPKNRNTVKEPQSYEKKTEECKCFAGKRWNMNMRRRHKCKMNHFCEDYEPMCVPLLSQMPPCQQQQHQQYFYF